MGLMGHMQRHRGSDALPGWGGNSVCIRPLIGLESPFRLAEWIGLVRRG